MQVPPPLLVSGGKTSLEGAAFANGTLGHVLDYDDVKSEIGHATVVVAPAILALGEKLGKCGLDILTAFLAGFECQAELQKASSPPILSMGGIRQVLAVFSEPPLPVVSCSPLRNLHF